MTSFLTFFIAAHIQILITFGVIAGESGALVVGIEAEPRTLDPRYAVDANAQYLIDLSQCSLIKFDKTGQIVPYLASSWEWLDAKTIKFKISPQAKFTDGTPVKPSDVRSTYDYLRNDKNNPPSPLTGEFKKITDIAVSTDTISFTLNEPDVSFLQNFIIGVLPATVAAKTAQLESSDLKNGCGPYTIVSQTLAGITMKANEKFSLGKKASIPTLDFKIVKDEQTRYAKLRKGELDLIQNSISRDKLADIAKTLPSLKVYRGPAINTTYLGFNIKDPILKNKMVRQAINLSIDRDQIIKYLLQGMATPARTMLASNDPFFAKDLAPPSFDQAKAQALLDGAGFKAPGGDKPRFTLSYKTTTDVTRLSIAQAIASQLAKIGIKITIQSLDWGKFKTDIDNGQVQLWSLSWVGFKDPDIYRHAFASEKFPPNGGNRGWFSNAKLDELLTSARQTSDTNKRRDIYIQVQKLVADETPYAFLWHEERFVVANAKLKGFETYADGRLSSLAEAHW